MDPDNYLHEVAVTGIIIKRNKYLITRRAATEKKLSGYWTVPGGRLEVAAYNLLPQNAENAWYNILDQTLRQEIKEEVGLEVKDIEYLTDLVTIHPGHNPSLIISCVAKYKSGKVMLQKDETDDFAWVSLKEAKNYQLIDGIYDELVMAEQKRLGKKVKAWKRF